MSIQVIDLSHWNTVPSSLVPAANSGVVGLIHKATEAGTYVDDKLAARYHLAKDAGLLFGCYHFLRPGNMQAQAIHFVDTMKNFGVFDDDTLVAADHEDSNVDLADLFNFLETVRQLTGRSPVIYSGHVLKEQMDSWTGDPLPYRLWLAQYTSGKPSLPNGFEKYWLWQYTDKGEVEGITPPTDLNRYDGSFDELINEWAGHPSSVEDLPSIEEDEEKVVKIAVDVYAPPGVRVDVTVINPGPEE